MKQLVALVWLLSALPLAAQQLVSVTSGEHNGFSRLVLRIDPDVEWEVVETRGLASLHFPDQSLHFSTARIFEKMPTTRIENVQGATSESGSDLQLTLNCRCEVQGYGFKGKYIVLDVYDGPDLEPVETTDTAAQWRPDSLPFIQPPNAPSRFLAFVMDQAPQQPRLLPDPPPVKEPTPTPQLVAPSEPEMAADVVAEPEGEAADTIVSDMEAMAGAAVSDMNTEIAVEDNPEMLARIEAAQAQLLAQLTRAADQGLVNFVPEPVKEHDAVEESPIPEPAPEEDVEPPALDPLLLQQLSARTAYANTTEDALSEVVNQFAMPQCLEDSAFSMEGWGGDGSFSTQLASLRRRLLGEFDIPDPNIAEEIVQLYLRYGLGAEARLVLAESGSELENAPLYSDMASLIGQEPALVKGPVLKGAGCGGAHEMWYLATGLGHYHVLEPLTITDAFASYPIEVRSLIGPSLAQAFIDRDQVEAAHVVLEIVRRAEKGVTPAQHMAEARVMETQGNFEEAAHIYQDVAIGNSEKAPEALIAYARTVLASGNPPPDHLLLDLESGSFFYRETKLADPLRLWEIKARAAVAGPDAAMAQIVENLPERPQIAKDLKAILTDLFETSTAEEVGDYPYAQMVLQYADMLDQGPEGDMARLKIAEEMSAIGLPETALDVLAPNLGRADVRARHIEAAAYVQLYEPARALVVLEDDDGLEAYKIRMSAYLQQEDFAAVAAMLNEVHAKDISINDIALRAGDWEKIKDAGAVGTLASYIQSNSAVDAEPLPVETLPPMAADETPSLKAARALLATNQESMRFLEEVIAEDVAPAHE